MRSVMGVKREDFADELTQSARRSDRDGGRYVNAQAGCIRADGWARHGWDVLFPGGQCVSPRRVTFVAQRMERDHADGAAPRVLANARQAGYATG